VVRRLPGYCLVIDNGLDSLKNASAVFEVFRIAESAAAEMILTRYPYPLIVSAIPERREE